MYLASWTHFRPLKTIQHSLTKQDPLSDPLHTQETFRARKVSFWVSVLGFPGGVGSNNGPVPSHQISQKTHLNLLRTIQNIVQPFRPHQTHSNDCAHILTWMRPHNSTPLCLERVWNPYATPLHTSEEHTFMFERSLKRSCDPFRPHKSRPSCLIGARTPHATPFTPHNNTPICLSKAWNPHATRFRPLCAPIKILMSKELETLIWPPFRPLSDLPSDPPIGPRNQKSQPQILLDPLHTYL